MKRNYVFSCPVVQGGSQEPLLQPWKSAVKKIVDVIAESLWRLRDGSRGKEQDQSLSQTKLTLLRVSMSLPGS